jgi:hypothetical protein
MCWALNHQNIMEIAQRHISLSISSLPVSSPRRKTRIHCASNFLFSPAAARRHPIHRPPLMGSINWACPRLHHVIKQLAHSPAPQILHQRAPISHSPKSLPNSARFDLAVASPIQVWSHPLCSCFSTLTYSWYSPTRPIELEPRWSPGTRLVVRLNRCHSGQSKLGSRSWNWMRGKGS